MMCGYQTTQTDVRWAWVWSTGEHLYTVNNVWSQVVKAGESYFLLIVCTYFRWLHENCGTTFDGCTEIEFHGNLEVSRYTRWLEVCEF